MRAAKVQASLRSLIQAVSQEEPSDRKPDPWPLWMAGHAQLQFVMTECSKTQIRLTRPISELANVKRALVIVHVCSPTTYVAYKDAISLTYSTAGCVY